jgi:hypothetical protein
MIRALPILVLAALLAPATGRAGGKLDKARDEVRTPPSASKPDDQAAAQAPYDGDGHSLDDCTSGDACPPDDPDCRRDGWGVLIGYTIGALFYLPHLIVEGPDPRDGWFGGPPYMDGRRGHMVFSRPPWIPPPPPATTPEGDLLIAPVPPPEAPTPPGVSPLALTLSAEYGHDLDALYKPAAYAMVSTSFRLGLESGWTWFTEETVAGEDWLVAGDINLIWRFAQAETVEWYSGAGVRLMADEAGWNAGFNFTYGLDAFPVDPLVLSASIDLGNLGWAFVVHGRAHLGVTRFGFELFAGWDVLAIGEVVFQGPLLGLRGWIRPVALAVDSGNGPGIRVD